MAARFRRACGMRRGKLTGPTCISRRDGINGFVIRCLVNSGRERTHAAGRPKRKAPCASRSLQLVKRDFQRDQRLKTQRNRSGDQRTRRFNDGLPCERGGCCEQRKQAVRQTARTVGRYCDANADGRTIRTVVLYANGVCSAPDTLEVGSATLLCGEIMTQQG